MKQAEHIWDTWDNGAYLGTNRSHGRVTVEPDWMLNITDSASYKDSKRGPFRWWQDAENDQTEIEVPNVKSISIDRSIDTDIASCNISVYNQYMDDNGAIPDLPGQLGKPGYLSWGHGANPTAAARWNQVTNSWENILLPNALLRTFQGCGGFNTDGSPMSIHDCLVGGYLTMTGAWLIDTVTLTSSGSLEIKCRDVGKLLGVQQYFPPLVPSASYLEQWCRWDYLHFDTVFNPRKPHITAKVADVHPKYMDSSADHWYGPTADIQGHNGAQSVDGSFDTFALSVGNYLPSRHFCCDWWEYEVNAGINEFFLMPWAGNYTMYVSILENGVWQTNNEGNIPYSIDDLIGTQPIVIDTGAAIPYVMKCGVPWEQGQWYQLPRTFQAQRIRISFRDHTFSQWGPLYYRSGIRDIQVRANTLVEDPPAEPYVFSMAAYNDPLSVIEAGYWAVADDGQVFAFGDARKHDLNGPYQIEDADYHSIVTIYPQHDGQGYWLLQANGSVYSYGTALHYGDGRFTAYVSGKSNFIDMAPTPSGNGYWLLTRSGEVVACGDAVHHGNAVPTGRISTDPTAYTGTCIESHPTLDGYWIVDGNGEVQNFGALPNYGGISGRSGLKEHEWVRCIRRNSTGTGYWILGGSGKIYHFGAATEIGQPVYPEDIGTDVSAHDIYRKITWSMCVTPDDDGLFVVQANGNILGAGNFHPFGSPGQQGTLRIDGNYKDYSDIVKTLLGWAGFLYYSPSGEAIHWDSHDPRSIGVPPIYGNIESTGAFADECIGLDQFDKKPIIDCINVLKEIVGYIFYIDDEGGACFQSPNWWSIGNFWQDGTPTDFLPEVDEATVLTDYSVVYSDEPCRSEIIISTEEPIQGNASTITTRIVPETSSVLRNIVKPAMWVNGVFKNPDEQRIMAELIAMHIWFQQRIGTVTALANPCIQLNDQVRIYERTTSETYVHYIRGISTTHDLDTGQYMMTLTTHWLGDEDDWVIKRDAIPHGQTGIQISPELEEWLKKMNSRAVAVARMNNFGVDAVDTIENYDTPPPEGGIGGGGHG